MTNTRSNDEVIKAAKQPQCMNRSLAILASLVVISLVSLAVFAERGGWVGSGGDNIRFSKNPWFVKNTDTVHYCVQVDHNSVSANDQTIQQSIENAIAYWKQEFSSAPPLSSGFAQLGSQDFILQTSCGADTDLHILVGYGTLNKEQIDFLDDPRLFIGITVRTDYDTVNLRGKGFMYISSDEGPYAYNTLPNTSHLIARAWQNQKLLQYAFMHEFGHVFGFPHTGTGLMSEVFLDQTLNQRFSKFYLSNPIQSFLNPPMIFDICTLNGTFDASFFQIPPDSACLRLEGTVAGGTFNWNVFSKKTSSSPAVPAGTIHADAIAALALGSKSASVVQLPPEQTVFTLKDRFINNFMIGPLFNEGGARGIFMGTSTHRPFDLEIDYHIDSITMTGIVNGRMTPVLVYSPPSLLNKILPIEM